MSENGRQKARRLFPVLGMCEECGSAKAYDRHHVNGDTFDNRRENLLFLCRRCHMAIDGRLEAVIVHQKTRDKKKPPKPCSNCEQLAKPLRLGLCESCYAYRAKHDVPRPLGNGWRLVRDELGRITGKTLVASDTASE